MLHIFYCVLGFRYLQTDWTPSLQIGEYKYLAPKPQPVDVFYQLIAPFSPEVWIIFAFLIIVSGGFTYCLKIMFDFKNKLSQNAKVFFCVQEKFLLDYFIIPASFLIRPRLLNQKWIKLLFTKTRNGLFRTFVFSYGAFFIVRYYRANLLSNLTVIGYEKPIDTAKGKIQNFIMHHSIERRSKVQR